MTELTPNGVVRGLLDLSRELAELSKGLDVLERNAVNAREDYTLALSRAFLESSGAMDLRKHQSIADTHTERIAAELAEAEVRGRKRQLDSIKVRIDVGRSAAAALRAEMSLT